MTWPMLASCLALAMLASACSASQPADRNAAIARAKQVYQQKEQAGTDFSTGPCIAEDLMPDWVADVAHTPRQPVDDRPENQCVAYREGRAHHFVELDPDGNLIRAQ